MSYRVGELEVQGQEPSNVVHLAFRKKTTDGGKARIMSRRLVSQQEGVCDLSMREADTAPCEYSAPAWDPA
jgi:hypothetical protein